MSLRRSAARMLVKAAVSLVRKEAASPAFDTTGTGVRLKGWTPSGAHINTLLTGSGATLRRQSRDLVRRDPYAGNALDKYVTNAIGTGIRPRSTHPDEGVRSAVNELWKRFADEADADGLTNIYGLQGLGLRSMLEGGDGFGRLRDRLPEDGLAVPFQIQLMESEMVPLDLTRSLGAGVIRSGVEYDAIGRRVAYHVLPYHPEDTAATGLGAGLPVRVPADRMLHLFRPLRPGQVRGVVQLASVMLRLYELDQVEDATVNKQKLGQYLTGFIRKVLGESGAAGAGSILGGDADTDDEATEIVKLTPGTFLTLNSGEEVSFFDAPDIGAGTGDFIKEMKRAIAAGAGVTYEQLTGDLSQVNYSSIRAGLLEFRRQVEQFQTCFFIFQFCRPIWRKFIETAVLTGALPVRDYAANRHLYLGARWVPQGFKWVDPVKEVTGLILAIRAGLVSRTEAIQMSGYDPEVIDAQLQEDNARADAHGLVLDSNPKHTSKAGVTNARPDGTAFVDAVSDPNAGMATDGEDAAA